MMVPDITVCLATKEDIARIEVKISDSKADMIKWMFIFWLGAVGTLAGIMFALLYNFSK